MKKKNFQFFLLSRLEYPINGIGRTNDSGRVIACLGKKSLEIVSFWKGYLVLGFRNVDVWEVFNYRSVLSLNVSSSKDWGLVNLHFHGKCLELLQIEFSQRVLWSLSNEINSYFFTIWHWRLRSLIFLNVI